MFIGHFKGILDPKEINKPNKKYVAGLKRKVKNPRTIYRSIWHRGMRQGDARL